MFQVPLTSEPLRFKALVWLLLKIMCRRRTKQFCLPSYYALSPLYSTPFLLGSYQASRGWFLPSTCLHFFAFLVVLVTMGPRSSATEVFTHFEDNAGWGSIGTACFVGISGPVITLLGSDSAVHLAEELKDSARNLPRAMLCYAGVNYLIGFVMLLAFMFVVGDVESVLSTPTGQPWIQVIWNATESKAATIVMTAIVALFFLFAAVNTNTTSSRQLYAFARDGGLPFSSWICRVSPNRHVPVNAVFLTLIIGCGLAVIPLGSTSAFLNIQAIGNCGITLSYVVSIACRIYNRNFGSVYGNLSKPPPFYLGKVGGNIINSFAIAVLIIYLVSTTFPTAPHPSPDLMNWSSLALGATILVAGLSYIRLRKTYLSRDHSLPVEAVEAVNVYADQKNLDHDMHVYT